ncbi:MAG: amino acid ABC transporter permease [Clostridiales bacterium]|nr:amino acid ABC transporter permease [Clostridiales bacterium]
MPADKSDDELLALAQAAALKVEPGKKISQLEADFKLNFLDDNRWNYLLNGLLVTLEITFAAVLLGIVIGVLVATVRSTWDQNSENMHQGPGKTLLGFFNGICKIYLTVIRGTPVVIQLMIMYYIIFASSRNGVAIAMLAFGINSGAYVAEIIRGGIMSVDRGQLEAGRSLGFNYVQTMRNIIIPQAMKSVLPALANEFIVLLKETSVSGYVAVQDLTKGGDIIRGVTYSAFLPLIAVALVYLIMVMFFTWLVGKLERRLRNSDH